MTRGERFVEMPLVLVESPFAGDVETNIRFARAFMRDALNRGEAPFASHLIYTQPGVLDDDNPDERMKGIEAGLSWGKKASKTIVYVNLGISEGMLKGIERAEEEGREIEYRILESWPVFPQAKLALTCLSQ